MLILLCPDFKLLKSVQTEFINVNSIGQLLISELTFDKSTMTKLFKTISGTTQFSNRRIYGYLSVGTYR